MVKLPLTTVTPTTIGFIQAVDGPGALFSVKKPATERSGVILAPTCWGSSDAGAMLKLIWLRACFGTSLDLAGSLLFAAGQDRRFASALESKFTIALLPFSVGSFFGFPIARFIAALLLL